MPQKLRLLTDGDHLVVILVLSTNNWDLVKAAIAEIAAAVNDVTPGSYAEVKIPE